VALHLGRSDEPREQIAYTKVAEFLARQHFTVVVAPKPEQGVPAVRATAGDCRILIAKSGFTGSDRERIRRYATSKDVVFVAFGGEVYAEQPTWLTVFDFLWAKFRYELGLNAQAKPIFVVIATRSCNASQLPWGELGR